MKKILILLFLLSISISVNAVVSITDSFTDGDYTANPTWTVTQGTFAVVANRLTDTAFPSNSQLQTGIVASSIRDFNLYATVNATNASSTGYLAILKRSTGDLYGGGDFNGYGVLLAFGGANNFQLAKYSSGVKTVLYQSTKVVSTGTDYKIGLQRIGNTLSVYYGGILESSVSDLNYFDFNAIAVQWTPGATANKTDDINLFAPDSAPVFRIVDEETQNGIEATLTINSIPWYVSPLGVFDVNNQITFPATFQVSKTNYDTRTFSFDTNAGLYQFEKIGLRTSSEAKDIDFVFYEPDQQTILSDRVIVATKGTVLVGRGKTSSLGSLTFNLAPQDADYNFLIKSSGSDTTTEYTYSSVGVSVLQAKNEVTNASITPNSFNLDIGGLGTQNYSAQSLPISTIVILGNTVDAYTLRIVDNNSAGQQYYARNYLMQTKGNATTLSIQPYLIPIADGILVNLRVYDLPSNITLPNIRTTLSGGIGGSVVVLEDIITDITGISQVVMLAQKQYLLSITSTNQDTNYFSGTVTANSTSQSFYINYTSTSSTYEPKQIYISISPTTNTIDGVTQRIDFNVSANFTYDSVFVEAWDSNYVRVRATSTANPYSSFVNLTLADFNSKIATVKIIVSTGDLNSSMSKSYFITSTGNGGITNLMDLENSFNPTNFLLTGVVAIVLFVGLLGVGKFGNFDQSVYIGGILLGIMSYLFFSNYFIYVIGALTVGAIAWMWTRVNK